MEISWQKHMFWLEKTLEKLQNKTIENPQKNHRTSTYQYIIHKNPRKSTGKKKT